MTDINNASTGKKHSQTSCKKRSTNVDLAPMVDLGFILLTFFVFTAAITQPMAMKLQVPNDTDMGITDDICESCVLTVLLGKDNNIWFHEGSANYSNTKRTNYSAAGIRKLIQQKKKAVFDLMHRDAFVLIVKPSAESSFKNLVDVVDECTISNVKRYYIDEIKDEDKKWLYTIR